MAMRARDILTKRAAWAQAITGAVVMAVALGAAGGIGTSLREGVSLGTWGDRLVPALLCTAIAVAAVRLLIGWPRERLGLTGFRDSTRAFLLGVGVTGGSAALLFAIASLAGWITWGRLDLPALLFYVAANALVAVLLEAFPEELTLRGMTWSALRRQHGGFASAVGTTVLFLFVAAGSSVVHKAVTSVFGGESPALGLAPAGEDPFSYFFLLTIFGLTLVAARTATSTASLWTCIGTHLTFLTVNRVTLLGEERDAGWSADFVNENAILIIPGYLVLAAVTYLLVARKS
ncbi:CPBP family glutamic-type intramembrane protease [Kribbella deserti]|uniref:Type II CAAX prenyl endopeptidase Rce1 family protein n=1 Tax=Kribbella deserti TaxID=1926257 RepID=A0ABV6QSA4_9ACTN